MSIAIPELDELFRKIGKDRLVMLLSGGLPQAGAGDLCGGCDVVKLTDGDVKVLNEFVARQREHTRPRREDYLSEQALTRLLSAECPPGWTDAARRNWLKGQLLEYALEEVSEHGGDVRCYAEPTRLNIMCMLSNGHRGRLDSLTPEERERRLLRALPGRMVARHAANRSLPEARKWVDVGALDCARLKPIVLGRSPTMSRES